MHIDFAPPSNGTYNNSGSSRQLANYMEHEDLERMERGIFTEGFFNLTDDNIYKSKVIKDIDNLLAELNYRYRRLVRTNFMDFAYFCRHGTTR